VSQRTGKKRAGFGIAAAATIAVLSACMVPSSQAVSQPTSAPAAAPAPAASAPAAASAAAVASAATLDPARIAAGRDLFGSWGCTACHTLADAKSNGAVGPSFDGDTALTEDFVKARVTNGQGAMPAFGGQLTPKEISDLAYYLTQVAKK
jgi:mono/diheme cytochrome c family protein